MDPLYRPNFHAYCTRFAPNLPVCPNTFTIIGKSFAKISQIIGFIKFGKNLLHTVETREFLVLNSCLPGKRLLRQATARTAQTAR
jgi:hypothetical protein